jgi:hypothetical protein
MMDGTLPYLFFLRTIFRKMSIIEILFRYIQKFLYIVAAKNETVKNLQKYDFLQFPRKCLIFLIEFSCVY